jgi:hypothetical protein
MIRQETYQRIAEEFGANIGIAEWSEPFYPYYTNIAKMPDELKVALLTKAIIKDDIYQIVIREIIRLETKYKNKRINKSTIYEKALNNLIEQNKIHSIV